jgi:murein L,D-transpeptidase YafK
MVPDVSGPFKAGAVKLAGLVFALALLAGCAADLQTTKTGTVYPATLALMDSLDMDRAAPILIRIFKEESKLEVWKQDRSGHFRPLKTYEICHFSGGLGPKRAAGDHQAPEGFYSVGPGQMNPNSREYLSFNVGYPNAFDRSLGRTGDSIMVHGGCRSVGCYAMTNEQIEEIFGLAFEAFRGGQYAIQLQAFPFRMTEANLSRHEGDPNMDFWRMLKAGSDVFAATKEPPRVAVCNQSYVFSPANGHDSPRDAGSCSLPGS